MSIAGVLCGVWASGGCADGRDVARSATGGHGGGGGGVVSSGSGGSARSGGGSGGDGDGAGGAADGTGGGPGSAGMIGTGGMAGSAGTGGAAGRGGLAGSGGGSGAGGISAQDGGTGATFTALYGAIFGTSTCAGTLCHNPGIQKGIDFSTRASASTSLKFEVVPGNSAGSALYRLLADGTMPPDPAPKLTATQLAAVAAWIDAGGLDD